MPDINVNKLSEALNTKADIDLNNTGVFSTSSGGVNLTSSTPANANGKEVTSADFIKSDIQSNLLNYTTNRILEIPQDIKLELNNGTLTLKAGSKVYVPNGFEADGTTPKFDVVIVQSDLLYTEPSTNKITALIFYDTNNNVLIRRGRNPESGSSVPSGFNSVFYNTSTNLCYNYKSGTQGDKLSFPIGVCTSNGQSTNNISSIDQVFNGFGYIGSTLFALPGVKIQIPNGRNADGTLKSIEHTNSSVITTQEAGNKNSVNLVLTTTAIGGNIIYDYDEKTNYCFRNDTGAIYTDRIIIGKLSVSSGRITSLEPFTVDSIVNSNASNFSQAGRSYLSGLGMPSSRYIDLTLGANGSTYTAPANGWFVISGRSTADGGYCILDTNNYEPTYMTTNKNGWYDRGFIPVRKGQVITLRYGNYEIEADRFKFLYAKGEQ